MKIKMLLFTLFVAVLITGCERVDVAKQDEYRIIPPVSSYNPNVESYWKFDVVPGFMNDSKFRYSTLTLVYTDSYPMIDSGRFDQAYQPSAGNYLYFPSGSSVLYDSARFLVEAWVRSIDTSGIQAVFSKCNTTIPEGWSCRITNGNPEIWYRISGGAAVTVTSTLSVPADGEWHYIAFIFGQQTDSSSNVTINFYVDGTSDSGTDISSQFPFLNSNTNLNFGYEWDGSTRGNFFNGSIDELAYWSLPEFISWDSIESTLARRNGGMQYAITKMLFY